MREGKEFHTKAGVLKGVLNERVDQNGILRSCMIGKLNTIYFQGEEYIPHYDCEDFRTKYRDAVTFYKSGELKSIYLEEQQEISSPIGKIKAEMVTFYKSGSMQRIFPIYGQVNGYWSESEEMELLPVSSFEVNGLEIEAKISCFHFYESGAVKSITLWPGERVEVLTPFGKIMVRFGISFYEDGTIESVEPEKPTVITFGTCYFFAFDNQAIGIHGDKNSLSFYEDGSLKSLTTTATAVVLKDDYDRIRIEPKKLASMTDIEEMEIYALKIEFFGVSIRITDSYGNMHSFSLEKFNIRTEQILENLIASEGCGDCSKCNHNCH